MSRVPSTSLVLILALTVLLTHPANAGVIYTFNTVSAAPLAGPVSGSFVVPDTAIADGFISASEIASFAFTLPSAISPFSPATFAAPDPLVIASPFAGRIAVDSATGHFLADSSIQITDTDTAQRLFLTTFPGTVPPLVPQYQVAVGTDPFAQFTQGSGAWTVSRVPEPPSIVLLGIGILALSGLSGPCRLLFGIWPRGAIGEGRQAPL